MALDAFFCCVNFDCNDKYIKNQSKTANNPFLCHGIIDKMLIQP